MKREGKTKSCHAQAEPDKGDNIDPKTYRKRTKVLVNQLKDQLEFYFSDSNLRKDRFLNKAISEHPEGYIAIETVASFNRMKNMTKDIELVVKAMQASSLLQVSDDETMVRRVTPLPEAKNVDAETVYVEKLPSYADHDWLTKLFSQYGKVTYVSLPRFKATGDIKGFAFIEFDSPKDAEKALKSFNKDNKTKKNQDDKGNGDDQQKVKKRRRSHSESELETKKQIHKVERKRRRTISESSADSGENQSGLKSPPIKRKACEEDKATVVEKSRVEPSTDDECRARKRQKSVRWEKGNEEGESKVERDLDEFASPCKKHKSSESESNAESAGEDKADVKKKHKKRKRKKKEKKETSRLPHLRVFSKIEWMKLKEEYKNIQRASMKEVKKQLQTRTARPDELQDNKIEDSERGEQVVHVKKPSTEVQEIPFTPGVVLKFKYLDTDLTRKEIRERFSSHAPVAYVDMTEGSGEGYVRFHTSEKCSAVFDLLSANSSESMEINHLKGEEERRYWEKINADRVARYQAKRENKRGTEKVAKKAEAVQFHQQTHIRFNNGD